MNRRTFLSALGLAAVAPQLACSPRTGGMTATPRRLRRVGIQLYTLRDDARRDLERTLVNIAQIGYKDVELLSSMNNFGMPPAQLRAVLDRNGLRAPSTHLSGESFDDLDRQIENAKILGHQYLVLASLHRLSTTTATGPTASTMRDAARYRAVFASPFTTSPSISGRSTASFRTTCSRNGLTPLTYACSSTRGTSRKPVVTPSIT